MLPQVAFVMDKDPSLQHTTLTQGAILHRTLANNPGQEYFLYVPHGTENDAKIFVTVHGISRNASEHAQKFAPFAEKHKVIMIAPHFPSDRFPDYQRLGREGKGERADTALNEIVAEVTNLTWTRVRQLYLFGYSGGAQFAHRYMLAYPERVAKVVLGAAGWYTFPDMNLRFPKGLQESRSLPQVRFNPENFLTIPVCVLVGEQDNRRDADLNKSPQIDLFQGRTRLERGRRWINAMEHQARAHGLITPYAFHVLPRSPHSFTLSMHRGRMGEETFGFLFANSADPNIP